MPPTSAYPSDPTTLERDRLDALYLELRGNYKSLMISRGIHRSRAEKQGSQLQELGQRLRSLATRQASVKAEAYAMLEIVTDVVEHLEDAGDEMNTAFGAYQLGRRSYNGGGNIGRLMQAVINFLNRWRTGKDHFEQLTARKQSLQATLEDRGLEESGLEESVLVESGLQNSRAPLNQPQSRQKQGSATGSSAQQLSVLSDSSQEAADGQDR
ncbi:MAG: hypothetical protein ACK5QQ_04275 [Cyanobacteriota bacterium]|nr:hypothetical protein [Cyanobium sp. 49614_E6]